MKTAFYVLILFLNLALDSCTALDTCSNSDVEEFNQFLGVHRSTKQIDLDQILNTPTETYFNGDSSKVICLYSDLEDAPVNIVFNAKTGNVETIMLEILSLGLDFNKDLNKAIEFYHIDTCESRFLGMSRDAVKNELGLPASEENQDGITLFNYFTKDYKTCITFKFYPEQNSLCSTILMNWYY